MRALVLWANDGSPNYGVRALAAGTAALVRRAVPATEVEFFHHGADSSAPCRPNTPRSVLRELTPLHRGFRDWLATFDLVVDTRSGDSFSDIYGMRRHTIMSGFAEMCARAGVPFVLGPQTIGPYSTRRGRALARRTIRQAASVMARDPRSAEESARLGRPVDALSTDVVFALAPPTHVDRERDVVLNVSGLLWRPNPHVDADVYRRTVHDLVEGLRARGRTVTLLAHVVDGAGTDDDVPAVTELAESLEGVDVVVPTSLDDVRATVAGSRLVLGSRMHACLNAMSVGTPAIPLAYSRKFDPLLSQLGWRYGVDLRAASDGARAALEIVDEHDARLHADASRTVERAEAMLEVAVGALARVVDARG